MHFYINFSIRFCLFGDTVNTASRMESTGVESKIQCSKRFADHIIKSSNYTVIPRGVIEVKGKGKMQTFFIEGHASGEKSVMKKEASKKISIMVSNVLSSPLACISRNEIDRKYDHLNSDEATRNLNVLVVSDKKIGSKIIYNSLREADDDWCIQVASSVESATVKLKASNFTYDVVIMVS